MAQPPHSNLPTVYPSVAPPGRAVLLSSYLLMAAALLLVMVQGLLPGLLCACLGFLLTRKLSELLNRLDRRAPAVIPRRWSRVIAATLIGLAPLLLLTSALSHTRSYVVEAPQQYRELLDYLASTVLELQQKLPPDLGVLLPQGSEDIQRTIANYLANKAGMLASTGKVLAGRPAARLRRLADWSAGRRASPPGAHCSADAHPAAARAPAGRSLPPNRGPRSSRLRCSTPP